MSIIGTRPPLISETNLYELHHLVWFINASKEIHGKKLMVTKFTDWTGLLEYTGDSIQGSYYSIGKKN